MEGTMLLTDLFANLYRPLRLRGRSPATTRLYGCTLRAFARWLGRDPVIADLDELVLARYLEHRATEVAPLTAEKERTQLLALANLAWERRLLEVKPCCPPGPMPDRIPTAWSVEELRRLFTAAASPATWPRDGANRARFFGALVPMLYETGERVGAALEATIEDYQRPTLILRAEARKGRKRDRCYRLTAATCDRLDELVAGRTAGRLFAWNLTQGSLYVDLRRIKQAAGLDLRRREAFHMIRRSAASHYAAAGGDAVEMLDHSSARITKRWYLDPRLVDRGARPCDLLPAIITTPAAVTDDSAVVERDEPPTPPASRAQKTLFAL
jgi:integrase